MNLHFSDLPKNIKVIVVIAIIVFISIIIVLVSSCTNKGVSIQKVEETLAQPLNQQEMLYLNLNNGGNIIFLNPREMIFNSFSPDSQEINKLVDFSLTNIQAVYYSFLADKAIINYKIFYDQDLSSNILMDFKNKTHRNIDENIVNIVWSQTENKIAYVYRKDDNIQLNIADPDGSNWSNLMNSKSKNNAIEPIYLSSNELFYIERTNTEASISGTVYKLNIQTKKIEKVFDQIISQFSFSADKKSMIYEATDDKTKLMIYNFEKKTNEETNLSENIFDDDSLYSYNTYPSSDISYKNLPFLFNENKMLVYFDENNKSLIFYNFKTKKKTTKPVGEIKYAIIDEENRIMYFTNNNLLFQLDIGEFYND